MIGVVSPKRLLSAVLWLTTAHSTAVGLGLIFFPGTVIRFFGFESQGEQFFQIQGGVFHLVMAVAYGLAAISDVRRSSLTEFAITAKFMATLFLCGYFLIVDQIWTVIASAAGDCLLGILILLAYLHWLRHKQQTDISTPSLTTEKTRE